jgi:hypothetical protein
MSVSKRGGHWARKPEAGEMDEVVGLIPRFIELMRHDFARLRGEG